MSLQNSTFFASATISLLCVIFYNPPARSADFQNENLRLNQIEHELQKIKNNPSSYFQSRNFNSNSKNIEQAQAKINLREELWKKNTPLSTLAPIHLDTDHPQLVTDRFELFTLWDTDRIGRKQKLAIQPWSDSYWPFYLTQVAQRYADPAFPFSDIFFNNENYIFQNLGTSHHLAYLSPAEKYDLAIGDNQFTLTRSALAASRAFADPNGYMARWMGICHGWAAASIMDKRPNRAILIQSPNGNSIPFYPADIKALASLLWANGMYRTKIAGLRCNSSNLNPPTQNCFDTNPATLHLALANQIGIARRSLIMDATWDAEVWNQPILGYEFSYFNPKTMTVARDIPSASVERNDFLSDRFRNRRSRNTRWIAGIVMDVAYMVETRPKLSLNDSAANDAIRVSRYFYDLEISADHHLIGGEWYSKDHPDFLWVPEFGRNAQSPGDALYPTVGLLKAAQESSQKNMPLRLMIDHLIQSSQ